MMPFSVSVYNVKSSLQSLIIVLCIILGLASGWHLSLYEYAGVSDGEWVFEKTESVSI